MPWPGQRVTDEWRGSVVWVRYGFAVAARDVKYYMTSTFPGQVRHRSICVICVDLC
jgi:hypothetical protein